MKLKINKKYRPLFADDSRFFIATGGRGSGKSFSIATFLALLLFEKGHTILFTRYTMTSAHISIIPEFVEKLELMGITNHFNVTKDSIENKDSGSKIIFRGIRTSSGDQSANLKSLQGVTTWVLDEAEELIDEKIFDKINLSVRQKGKQNRVILILNPTTKEHWIYKRFFEETGVEPGNNTKFENTTYIHTDYLDNIKNVDESFIFEIEQLKLKNPKKFRHTIKGGWLDKAEGVIYSNWRIGEFDNSLPIYFGQDWGWHPDPTVLIKCAIDKKNKKFYVDEQYYLPKLSSTEIADKNKQYAGKNIIISDVDNRLITELQRKGLNIRAVKKGPGSILAGITILQDYEIIVTPTSTNVVKELNNYSWEDKKSNTPQDSFNHSLDCIRYVALTFAALNNGLTNKFLMMD